MQLVSAQRQFQQAMRRASGGSWSADALTRQHMCRDLATGRTSTGLLL
jgi:hypothetical protein